jgi:ribokinase
MNEGAARGLNIYFNPAPFDSTLLQCPLEKLKGLILNQTEAVGFIGDDKDDDLADRVAEKLPNAEVLLTLGSKGAEYRDRTSSFRVEARSVAAVDATAAGDTFIGYYLAARAQGSDALSAVERATAAAAICVSRPGAMDSIPTAAEVDRL